MDEIAQRRIARMQTKVTQAFPAVQQALSELRKAAEGSGISNEDMFPELMHTIGVPPEADVAYGTFLVGNAIGAMLRAQTVSVEHMHSMLNIVANIPYRGSPYDVCADDACADAIDALADQIQTEANKESIATVYRWGRMMRAGLCEVVFALEDALPPSTHPDVIEEMAFKVAALVIEIFGPALMKRRDADA